MDHLLVVLTDGAVVWDPSVGDFEWQSTTALSVALRKKFPDEPLYVDLRWARTSPKFSLSDSRFREHVVSLAAPIRGIPRDELDSADVRQLRRNKILVRSLQGGLGLLTIVALSAATYAIAQKRQAIGDAALARAQASASRALLTARTTPMTALSHAVAASDIPASFPPATAVDGVAIRLTGGSSSPPAPPSEADTALRLTLALSTLRHVFTVPSKVGIRRLDGSVQGPLVALTLTNGSVAVIDATRGSLLAYRERADPALAAFVMSSGRRVLLVGKNSALSIWDLGSGLERITGSLPEEASAHFAATPEHDILVRNGKSGLWLIDLRDGTAQRGRGCRGAQRESVLAAGSVAGRLVTVHSTSDRSLLLLCDARSGLPRGTVHSESTSRIATAMSSDGRLLAAASMDDEAVRIWQLPSGKPVDMLKGHTAVPLALAFGAGSGRIAVGIADGNAVVWRIRKWDRPSEQQDPLVVASGAGGSIYHVAEVDNGRRIVSAHAGVPQSVRVWAGPADSSMVAIQEPGKAQQAIIDPVGGRVWVLTETALVGYGLDAARRAHVPFSSEATGRSGFTRDGRCAFSVLADGTLRAWVMDEPLRAVSVRAVSRVRDVQSAGKGCSIAVLDEAGEVAIHDLDRPERVNPTLRVGSRVTAVRFGDTPELAVTQQRNSSQIYVGSRVARRLGARVKLPSQGSPFVASATAILSIAEFESPVLLAVDPSKPDVPLIGHAQNVTAAEISPDGTRVVTGSDDWTARIWDAANGASLAVLRGHVDGVASIKFRTDGRLVATAGRREDATVRIWDPRAGEQLQRVEFDRGSDLTILAFSEAHLLINADGRLHVLSCESCASMSQMLETARSRVKATAPIELAPSSAIAR